ncbi:hypothetical protein [Paenibacillus sp. OK076]|uniref:hypothetical protein n=1 Tax=Paenibacillus sp. OK076 TaxID=1884379 RepID=UPI0015A59C30|nr:hypothetical protein [Paenibacillus sp. OK076]
MLEQKKINQYGGLQKKMVEHYKINEIRLVRKGEKKTLLAHLKRNSKGETNNGRQKKG